MRPLTWTRALGGALLALSSPIASPRVVLAHAVPVAIEPGANAVLDEAPREVAIRYSERVEPRASSLQVLDPRGRRVDAGDARVDPGDPWRLRVGTPALEPGTYTVSWRVLSADDGHLTDGAHAFVIGEIGAELPPAARVTASRSPLMVLGRWMSLLGQLFLLGGLGGVVVFRDAGPPVTPRPALWAGLSVIGLGELIAFLAQARQIAPAQDLWAGLGALIPTAVGRIWMLKVALITMLAGLIVAWRRAGERGAGLRALAIGVTVLILTVGAVVSHSAAAVEFRVVAIGAQALHLVGVALWIGGLGYFATLFWTSRAGMSPTVRLAGAIPAFSLLATTAVGALTLSGVYLARLHLGAPGELVATPYGQLLLVKLGLVAVMLGLGAYHQVIVHRRLVASLTHAASGGDRIGPRFRRTLRAEAGLGVGVLLVAAVLGTTSPPHAGAGADAGRLRHEHDADDARVVLEVWPLRPGRNAIRVTVTDRDGRPLGDAKAAVVQLVPADAGVGPVALTLEPVGPGSFLAARAVLGMEGRWGGRLVIQREGAFDVNDRFELALAAPSHHGAHGGSPGAASGAAPLDWPMGLAALAIAAVSLRLFHRSRRELSRTRALIGLCSRLPAERPDGRT